jgi:Arc/MetJ family transcription regulator
MDMSGAKTKKEAVNQALKDWVCKMALHRLRAMRGKGWEGDLDQSLLDGVVF